jgi:hypothetical protein
MCVGNELLALPDPDLVYVITFTRVNIKGESTCREHIALYWANRRCADQNTGAIGRQILTLTGRQPDRFYSCFDK